MNDFTITSLENFDGFESLTDIPEFTDTQLYMGTKFAGHDNLLTTSQAESIKKKTQAKINYFRENGIKKEEMKRKSVYIDVDDTIPIEDIDNPSTWITKKSKKEEMPSKEDMITDDEDDVIIPDYVLTELTIPTPTFDSTQVIEPTDEENNKFKNHKNNYGIIKTYLSPIKAINAALDESGSGTLVGILNREEINYNEKSNVKITLEKQGVMNIINMLSRNIFLVCQKNGSGGITDLLERFSKTSNEMSEDELKSLDIPNWMSISKTAEDSKYRIQQWETKQKEKNNARLEVIRKTRSKHLIAILDDVSSCYHFSYETIKKFESKGKWICAYTSEKIVNGEEVHIIRMAFLRESSYVRYFYVKSKRGDSLFYVNSIMAYVYYMAYPKVNNHSFFFIYLLFKDDGICGPSMEKKQIYWKGRENGKNSI